MLHDKDNKLLIKNMVCNRCIMSVEQLLNKMDIPFGKVTLGEVELLRTISPSERQQLNAALHALGFDLIATRVHKIVEDIKLLVSRYLQHDKEESNKKLSSFITDHIHYDYAYVSDLFSSIEGITIEQFFIALRIEKVKELLVYDQLSLTEIAYKTGFSSVHHLSAQFKKVTGLTPSHFKKIGADKRKAIDSL